jgi:hypothetical protein
MFNIQVPPLQISVTFCACPAHASCAGFEQGAPRTAASVVASVVTPESAVVPVVPSVVAPESAVPGAP